MYIYKVDEVSPSDGVQTPYLGFSTFAMSLWSRIRTRTWFNLSRHPSETSLLVSFTCLKMLMVTSASDGQQLGRSTTAPLCKYFSHSATFHMLLCNSCVSVCAVRVNIPSGFCVSLSAVNAGTFEGWEGLAPFYIPFNIQPRI